MNQVSVIENPHFQGRSEHSTPAECRLGNLPFKTESSNQPTIHIDYACRIPMSIVKDGKIFRLGTLIEGLLEDRSLGIDGCDPRSVGDEVRRPARSKSERNAAQISLSSISTICENSIAEA
jgi:hypothetical protein